MKVEQYRIGPINPFAGHLLIGGAVALATALAAGPVAAARPSDGLTLEPPVNVSLSSTASTGPAVARSGDRTLAVWEEGERLRYAFRGATWSAPADVPGALGFGPAVAASGDGTFDLVYTSLNPVSDYLDVYSLRFASGAWGTPENLSDSDTDAIEPDVAVNNVGDRFVVWSEVDDAGGSALMGASSAATGAWSVGPIEDLDGEGPAVAAGPSGWWLAWTSAVEPNGPARVFAMHRSEAGWSLPELVSSADAPTGASATDIAATDEGSAAAVWLSGGQVSASTGSVAGWSVPRQLSFGGSAGEPAVTDLGAAWTDEQGLTAAFLDAGTWSSGVLLSTFDQATHATVTGGDRLEAVVSASRGYDVALLDVYWIAADPGDFPTPTPSASPGSGTPPVEPSSTPTATTTLGTPPVEPSSTPTATTTLGPSPTTSATASPTLTTAPPPTGSASAPLPTATDTEAPTPGPQQRIYLPWTGNAAP